MHSCLLGRARLTERLVISEHTEETLSQKEWEEKLLAVRAGAPGVWPILGTEACFRLGWESPGSGCLWGLHPQQSCDGCLDLGGGGQAVPLA